MSWLSLLLIIKIGVTAPLVALPFLFLSKSSLERATGITAGKPVFFRLYGVSMAAILVGYSFGIPAAEHGIFPWGVTSMGIVSNLGGAVLLLSNAKGSKANILLGTFLALIVLGLVVAMIAPVHALTKAW